MKTPIQELLSIVSDLKTRGENDGTSDGLIIKTCMNMVEKIINDEALIEKEKKAINDAYFNGFVDCSYTELDDQKDDFTDEQTNHYYNKTFNK